MFVPAIFIIIGIHYAGNYEETFGKEQNAQDKWELSSIAINLNPEATAN